MEEKKKGKKYNMPIGSGLNIIFSIIFLNICILTGLLSYKGYRDTIVHDNMLQLEALLQYTADSIDKDGFVEGINKGVRNQAVVDTEELCRLITQYVSVEAFYIIIPSNTYEIDNAVMVVESANGKNNDVFLKNSGNKFDSKNAQNNLDASCGIRETKYFVRKTPLGRRFCAATPLMIDEANSYTLLCVDVDYEEIIKMSRNYAFITFVIVFVLGLLLLTGLRTYLSVRVVKPLAKLEKKANDLSKQCENNTGLSDIKFENPHIHTGNEVESLANTISKMAESIHEYAMQNLVAQESVAQARQMTEEMSRIAFQDPLTRVKNKLAYEEIKVKLNVKIVQEDAAFAFVMVDINGLKYVNDTFGHEHGDEYIIGSSRIICDVYDHSKVFRIGGDEFVVFLEGRDYEDRDELFKKAQEIYKKTYADDSKEPWERYSAAVGMGVYEKGDTVESVIKRADDQMYANKVEMKKVKLF